MLCGCAGERWQSCLRFTGRIWLRPQELRPRRCTRVRAQEQRTACAHARWLLQLAVPRADRVIMPGRARLATAGRCRTPPASPVSGHGLPACHHRLRAVPREHSAGSDEGQARSRTSWRNLHSAAPAQAARRIAPSGSRQMPPITSGPVDRQLMNRAGRDWSSAGSSSVRPRASALRLGLPACRRLVRDVLRERWRKPRPLELS
jgi:hypothetical protein